MIAAAHLDNFLFLIFFAIAILFQLLTRVASKSGRRGPIDQKRTPTAPPQMPRQPEDSDEDRIRKFLEALGQPTTSKPPPPVVQRPSYQRPIVVPPVEPRPVVRRVLAPLPPLTTQPPEFQMGGPPAEGQMPPPAPMRRERRVFPPKFEVPAFEVQQGPPSTAPIVEPETAASSGQQVSRAVSKSEAKLDIPTLLRSRSGVRNAIILREIFGPPRSMQPLDLVGNV